MIDVKVKELLLRVLEESAHDHDKAEWQGFDTMMSLSALSDTAILELEMAIKEEVVEEPHRRLEPAPGTTLAVAASSPID
ncbi:hypothetical protein D1007_11849 [Hordeum vulgare]|nr:hypothetical protein D1007_11849 [Hordeum vulgare]